MAKLILTEEGSKPQAPSVGQSELYPKSDDNWYTQNSAGVEVQISGTNAIDTLIGDVTATGPGTTTATVTGIQGHPVATGTPANGDLLIGNGTGYSLNTLTAGAGVTITNGPGTISIAATGSGGTVTSVSVVTANGFSGTVATATTTPAITIATTVTGILYGNGTSVAVAIPSNFPTLNQNTTGTSSNVTGTVAIANGGTGQVTSAAAFNALSPMSSTGDMIYESAPGVASALHIGTTGQILSVAGGIPSWTTPAATGVTSVALADGSTTSIYTITNSPVTSTGTLTFTLDNQSANTVFAGPTSGSAAQPTFRALVNADVSTLTVSNITATTNATLTTLSSLSLPYTQITGAPPVSGFTQGSILFANSLGQISQDNANFYWNDTNQSIGIGTATPASNAFIDGVNVSGAAKRFQLTGYGTGSTVGYRGRFANGTLGSPTAATNGNILGFFSAQGYGASSFPAGSTGAINVVAGETFTNSSNLTYLSFLTTPTGSVTAVESMRVASTGITFGPQTSSTAIHTIAGGVINTTRTTTASFTVDTTTTDYIIFCNNTTGITITLPTPTNGRSLIIKDINGNCNVNNITIAPHAGEQIEGLSSSYLLQTNFGCIELISDGTNWWIC